MVCPKCGANTPDGIPNCVKCGTVFDGYTYDSNIDYQQVYYKQKVDRNNNIKNFGNSVNQGFNNMGNSINNGFQTIGNDFNKAANSVQNRVQAYQNSSELNKKGDDAFIMSIVAIVLSFLGFNVISLVLGIIALKWAKMAYPVTKVHNHEVAKTLSIVAIVVSAIEVGAIVISSVVSIIMWLVGTGIAFSSYGNDFGNLIDEYIMICPLF